MSDNIPLTEEEFRLHFRRIWEAITAWTTGYTEEQAQAVNDAIITLVLHSVDTTRKENNR
jgi:hypothetical protein